MKNPEIQKANRRALPKFILFLLLSLIVGGCIGFFSAEYELNTLTAGIKSVSAFFGAFVAPWLMLALAVAVPAVSAVLYRKAKNQLAAWDGEDESTSDAAEEKLSVILWLSSVALILSYFLITATYSGGSAAFENAKTLLAFKLGIAAFFAILIETVVIQQKCVDAAKQTNPEKTASVYDMRFQKKWLDSCDEAEKIMIGRCAWKAYGATNTLCAALAVLLAVCALVFEIGFLPSLVVCLIWLVNQSVYCKESIRYGRAGNRIL